MLFFFTGVGTVTIKKLQIELLDILGNNIDLDGYNINLVLDFTILYNSQRSKIYQNIL